MNFILKTGFFLVLWSSLSSASLLKCDGVIVGHENVGTAIEVTGDLISDTQVNDLQSSFKRDGAWQNEFSYSETVTATPVPGDSGNWGVQFELNSKQPQTAQILLLPNGLTTRSVYEGQFGGLMYVRPEGKAFFTVPLDCAIE